MINTIEWLKKQDNRKVFHRAIVVDNEDPEKLGRVKCYIFNLIEAEPDKLPWCYPINPPGLGGSPNTSSLIVPEVNTEVLVAFPYEDIYFPHYIGFWRSDDTDSKLFEENYPEIYGWIDSLPQWWRVDKSVPYSQFYRDTQSDLFHLDDKGNLQINVPNNLVLNIGGNFIIKIAKSLVVQAAKNISLAAGNIFSSRGKSSMHLATDGDMTQNAKGNQEIKTGGDQGINAGGTATREGSEVHDNSGITVGISSGNMDDLDSDVSDLESEISDLEKRLEDLKKLASDIKSDADSERSDNEGEV